MMTTAGIGLARHGERIRAVRRARLPTGPLTFLQHADSCPKCDLTQANLEGANLEGANLNSANLEGADLELAKITGATLAYANLTNALYAPASPPPDGYVAEIEGIRTVVAPSPGDITGLVQLRKLLQDAGLPEEREATYAIERNKTRYLLFGKFWDEGGVTDVRWNDPQALAEGVFRLIFFEFPIEYGLNPARALWLLIAGIIGLGLVYAIALTNDWGTIYCIWPRDRLEHERGDVKLAAQGEVDTLQPYGFWASLRWGLRFSLLSAFQIGWNWLNVGTWITRLQGREYTLQAIGWMRRLSGLQSLLSVYLLAMWALSYFGRPFG